MRALLLALAATSLAGCTYLTSLFAPAAEEETADTCPAVRRADAWVNRMPGPSPQNGGLVVVVELETPDRWMLRTISEEEAPPVLVLALQPGGTGHPGSAGYRSARAGHPDKIEIRCGDRLHHTISEVMSVY
ncbi:MAG: hypothetical protein ACK4MQ_08410 [Hyphomonas sp.]